MATGRDELLKKNQRKSKKKGLMDVLSDYQADHGYGSKATKGQGPVKSGKTYGALLKKNKKEDAGGPKGVLAPKKKTKPATKPATKKTVSNKTPPKKDTGKSPFLGRTDGVRGESLPSNPKLKSQPKPPRKKRPGTGRTGYAAVRRANRPKARPAKTMTVAQRRAMRLRARRGR